MRYVALTVLLALAACNQDPFERPGTWSVPQSVGGANDANLRAMVTDPRDLVAGTGEENSVGSAAVAPVRRLLTGRRPPLPQSNVSTLRLGGGSAAAPLPGGAAVPLPQE